jgi:hypothetical protein
MNGKGDSLKKFNNYKQAHESYDVIKPARQPLEPPHCIYGIGFSGSKDAGKMTRMRKGMINGEKATEQYAFCRA